MNAQQRQLLEKLERELDAIKRDIEHGFLINVKIAIEKVLRRVEDYRKGIELL